MDIQAGSGHRADHPGSAQLPALPAPPGTGLGTGTPPWHRAGHGDTARTLLHPGRSGTGPSPGALAEAEAALAPVLALLCWIPGNLEISAWIGRLCGGSAVSESPSGTPQPASTLVAAGTPYRLWAWLSRQEHQLQPQGLQSHQTKSPKAEGFVHLCHALETAPAEVPDARLAPIPDHGCAAPDNKRWDSPPPSSTPPKTRSAWEQPCLRNSGLREAPSCT